MKRFSLGLVVETFSFVIDGHELEIVKHHPWIREGCQIKTGIPNLEVIEYHCEEIRESAHSMMVLIIAWMVNKQIGWNHDALVCGIARMLKLKEMWRRFTQLCHPDKHDGSVVATEATRWLLENRP